MAWRPAPGREIQLPIARQRLDAKDDDKIIVGGIEGGGTCRVIEPLR